MARNAPNNRRESSRVTKSPVRGAAPAPQQRGPRDRRQFWVKFVAILLVLFMLMPVVAFFF